MCTVSFIAAGNQFFITSNRDEKPTRKKALPPAIHYFQNCSLYFPKDAHAGGTWIAAKNNGDAAVLLNGAFFAHTTGAVFGTSRGLLLVEILRSPAPLSYLTSYNCEDIEPFTLVLFVSTQLYECRWNGEEKFFKQLSLNQAHIWSSATLYTSEIADKRKTWFLEWLKKNPLPTMESLMHFHRFAGDGDKTNDLLMNRENTMATVSITSLSITNKQIGMRYWDAIDDCIHAQTFPFCNQGLATTRS